MECSFVCVHMHGYNCQKMMSLEERVSTCTINVPITTILDKLLKKFWLRECIWQPSLYLPTISRSWKKNIYLHFAYCQNIWLDHLKYKLFKNVPFKIPKDISCNWSEIQDGYHKGLIVHNLLLLMVNLK